MNIEKSFSLIVFLLGAAAIAEQSIKPVLPIKEVIVECSIVTDADDYLTPKNRSRNDTTLYFLNDLTLTPKIQDNNLVFWEKLINESEIKVEPENYLYDLCGCACSSADIIITDANNRKFKLEYIDCGKMDIRIQMNKMKLLMKQSNESWKALDDKMKIIFKATLDQFQIQK